MPRVEPPESVRREAFSQAIIVGKLREVMKNVPWLAERTGLSVSGLYKKLKETDRFTMGEFRRMVKCMGWSDAEVVSFVRGKRVEQGKWE